MTKRIQRSDLQGNKSLAREIPMQDFGMEIEMVRGRIEEASLQDELEQCRHLINHDIEDNFLNSETPDGQKWPERVDPGDGHPLLVLSMALMLAAVGEGPGGIQTVGDRSLSMNIDLAVIPYARAQDRGFPPNNLPARNYFGARQSTLDKCRRIIMRGMKKKAWPSAYD